MATLGHGSTANSAGRDKTAENFINVYKLSANSKTFRI